MTTYPTISPGAAASAIERALSSVGKDRAFTPNERDLTQQQMEAGIQMLRFIDPHRDAVRETVLSKRRSST